MSERLVLASASPRRREILAGLGLVFTVRPAALDESARPGESPAQLVARLAAAKATATVAPGELVLGADTVVVVDGEVLGKPAGASEAAVMLRRLAGRSHRVVSGLALAAAGAAPATARESTTVRLRAMSEEEIAWYVATGEPLDKAGAYAVQGLAALFVTAVEGSYSNVVGLPVATLYELVRRTGRDLRQFIGR